MKHRVAITGIGAVTPIGCGVDGLWDGVLRGQSAVGPVSRFDPTPFNTWLAAEIHDFDPASWLEPKRVRRLDRFSQISVVAAIQAVADACLSGRTGWRAEAGCYLGSALGGVAFGEEQHAAYVDGGASAVSPSVALSVFGGAGSSNVAIELGLTGPSMANSNSCASGAIAIGEAFRLIRDGQAPVMLAGGAEAPLAPLTFGSFALIRAMSKQRSPELGSRPFDVDRDGFVMGEGSAMLVLESFEHAEARGARVYAEMRGYGMTNDAHHMLAPLPDGREAARAMRLALTDAELPPSVVEYVNAHASSTPLGDRAEAVAIADVVGSAVPVSGTKGLYGHPLGASGAIEAAICALAIARGFTPGTAGLRRTDADTALTVLGPRGRHERPEVVLSNACGFGGINAALVLAAP